VSDIISGGLLGHLGQLHLALGPNHKMVETRLQSEYFDILDDLLGFQVQKLLSKVMNICD